jgi:hypothetical protein
MRRPWPVIAWLPLMLLTACVASPPGAPTGLRPATDALLTTGDIQVAQEHLRQFGFDPGPVDGRYTAQTQAAVRGYQARYGLPVTGLLDESTRRELLPGFERLLKRQPRPWGRWRRRRIKRSIAINQRMR